MRRTNFNYLLVALLVLLFAVPLADDLDLLGTTLSTAVIFSVLLIVGIRSLKGGGRFFSAGTAFVVIGVLLNLTEIQVESTLLRYATLLTLIAFLLVATSFAMKKVIFTTTIDLNRLVGAICVYLMIGVIFAFIYSLLELHSPGSFTGINIEVGRGWSSDWLYFSFVTLSTLGYGDMSAVSPIARTFAYLQALAGQFYIAVLVAGLVSAYISDKQNS